MKVILHRSIFLFYFIYFICNIQIVNGSNNEYYNYYGDAYGVDWMFFPDGDGVPRFVSLLEDEDHRNLLRSNKNDQIEYRLYTRDNKDVYELLNKNAEVENKICPNGCFNPNKPIKLVTHGWMSAADKSAVMLIKDAYLKTYDVNVIGVDWSSISESYLYPFVAKDTGEVGKAVGRFLGALAAKYGVIGKQIHLIGHSLGAHVMGNAASTSKLNISRITGLDPARPLFEVPMRDSSVKLDPSDAAFVDIVHTCAGVLGVEAQIGHADFYPNNGSPPQPGCQGVQAMMEACSHGRAHIYFAEAVESPQSFKAHHCKDWSHYVAGQCSKESVFMGENVDPTLRGLFYLATNSKTPFGKDK